MPARTGFGRPDPRPGNFQPRFGSTNEFEAIVSQEAHRNLKWFFDVYLRQAHLPRLVTTRQGQTLYLQWTTPHGLPFPMPVDVQIDKQTVTVPMTNGRGSVTLPSADSLVTVDPDDKILRQNDAIDAYRDEQAKNRPKKTAVPPRRARNFSACASRCW